MFENDFFKAYYLFMLYIFMAYIRGALL